MESRTQRYMFRMTDCAAIVNELDVVDWFSLFSGSRMDFCVDLFYEIFWSCFEKLVPMKLSRGGWKLTWITSELNCLKNKKTKTEEAIKRDPKTFFDYVDLKTKRVVCPSVMHFESRLASGPDDICDLFADFKQQTYVC
jgi:hypothetical protein